MVDIPAPGWLCARRSRAGSSHSHRGVQVLGMLRCRDVAGQPCIQVIRSVAAAARSASFQAGPLRRWRPPTFLFTPPNLKEDGKSPQSRPSPRPAGKPVHSNNPPPLTTVPRPKFPSLSPFSADLLPRRLPLICPWSRRGLGGARIRFRVTMRTLSSAAIIFRGQGVERGGGLLPAGLHPNNSCLTVCPHAAN